MSEQNTQILLASRPEGLPTRANFDVVRQPRREPRDGEVLVRNVYLSLDPAMRGWMSDRKSYIPPVRLGDVMRGLTAGEVVASAHPDFKPGDRVTGTLGWQEYGVARGEELHRLPGGVSLQAALGPLGMTGLTAYFGLLDVGKPRAGETVLVSGGAGAVGSVVGQIARIKGCRAVGIAGGPDKCRYMSEELGFDDVIDYKSGADLRAEIERACPGGVDVYFDNVGGETLDAALTRINRRARVVICGAISIYNATEPPPGPHNYLALLVQRARMEGFIIFDYQNRYAEALAELGPWVASGEIKWRSEVVDGLENAPEALLRLFDGNKLGKLLVKIGPEPAGPAA